MVIEWKLENQKYCDGCCCFDGWTKCFFFKIRILNVNNKGKTKRPYKCLAKNSI